MCFRLAVVHLIAHNETEKLIKYVQQKEQSHNIKEQQQKLYSSVMYKLLQGSQNFSTIEELVIEEEVRFFSQELVEGIAPEELEEDTIAAFKYYGIDPYKHSTWLLHTDDCDGFSGSNCEEGEIESVFQREIENFDEKLFFE